MKKVILLFVVLFASFGLVACGDDATLEWETMPKSVYTAGDITEEVFKTSVKVKINGESVTLADAISKHGATVTGLDLESPGSKQLVVKFKSLTITWDYTVGEPETNEIEPDTNWYDKNKEETTFTLDSIRDLYGLAKLVNNGTETFAGKTVKLGVDIDLSDKVWTPIGQGTRKMEPVSISESEAAQLVQAANRDFLPNRKFEPTTDYKEDNKEYIYLSNYTFAVRTNAEDNDIDYYQNSSDEVEGGKFFKGTFDGQNHKIKGLSDVGYTPTVTRIYANSTMVLKGYVFGLFGIVEGDVTIKNVVFENVAIIGAYYDSTEKNIVKAEIDSVGAAIGYVNKIAGNLVVENVKVLSGSITASNAAAGIVGRFYHTGTSLFKDVENHANISVLKEGKHAGGIAGYGLDAVEFINAKNYGNITIVTYKQAGGILNRSNTTISIIDSSNFGTISGAYITDSTDKRYGLVGQQTKNWTITNSLNFGTVK